MIAEPDPQPDRYLVRMTGPDRQVLFQRDVFMDPRPFRAYPEVLASRFASAFEQVVSLMPGYALTAPGAKLTVTHVAEPLLPPDPPEAIAAVHAAGYDVETAGDIVTRLRRDFGPWNDQEFEFASLGLEAASAIEDLRAEGVASRTRQIKADALLREVVRQGVASPLRQAIAAYLIATSEPTL